MPAMLDDPTAPVIYRTSGDVPYPPPGGPLPVGIAPYQVILRDRVTSATIIPFSAPNQVPLTLLAYLCDQLGREIEKGDTYPMVEPLTLEAFGPYWFGVFGAIMLLGEIQDGRELHEMARRGCDWERECLGSFYIKPNYPGRSSHVCNGGFLVTDASRNRGVGRLMGETYLDWAPKLGYTYSVFNLVYETNVASCRIWDALGFKRIGRVKGCGNLKSYPGELVDAIIYGRDLGQDDEFVSEERFDKIRFYLKNGKYPNGADRAEKSRLRSAATHYKLTPGEGDEPEKLWLKECSEMNKGLSAMRQGQNQARAEARSGSSFLSSSATQPNLTPTPPSLFSPTQPPPPSDSPNSQLQLEAAQQQDTIYPQYSQDNGYDLPVDPALMQGMQPAANLADLPPSPFLAAQVSNRAGHAGELDHQRMSLDPGLDERAPTAGEEMRRRLNLVSQYK
ncbi:hypothetical protein AA0116_g9106 [Alternaria tenuissima]|nr:hypothetical protein AA0116_g9106 [Alternaria tenuissima]